MFKPLFPVLPLSAVFLLAACSGGGSGSSPVSAAAPIQVAPFEETISSIFGAQGSGFITVPQIQTATDHLGSMFDAADEGLIFIERPNAASVSLNGLIGSETGDIMTVGRLTLDADLAANSVSGSATDFSVFSNGSLETPVKLSDLTGALVLSNGIISGSSMAADLNGVLSGDAVITYDAELSGSFLNVNDTVHGIGSFQGTSQTGEDTAVDIQNGAFLVSE